MIRDFELKDYETVKRLHEESGADYRLPALTFLDKQGVEVRHPLFAALKVLEIDGEVCAVMGGRLQAEMYLWAKKGKWPRCDAQIKMAGISALNTHVLDELYYKGIDDAVCYIPPTMKRFVERVKKWLHYKPPREGWTPLSRGTARRQG